MTQLFKHGRESFENRHLFGDTPKIEHNDPKKTLRIELLQEMSKYTDKLHAIFERSELLDQEFEKLTEAFEKFKNGDIELSEDEQEKLLNKIKNLEGNIESIELITGFLFSKQVSLENKFKQTGGHVENISDPYMQRHFDKQTPDAQFTIGEG